MNKKAYTKLMLYCAEYLNTHCPDTAELRKIKSILGESINYKYPEHPSSPFENYDLILSKPSITGEKYLCALIFRKKQNETRDDIYIEEESPSEAELRKIEDFPEIIDSAEIVDIDPTVCPDCDRGVTPGIDSIVMECDTCKGTGRISR